MEFPILKTGAVTQYPAGRSMSFRTQIVEYTDGKQQRSREQTRSVRHWLIKLSALDEAELNDMARFLWSVDAAGVFTFTDPWDGAVYDCSVEERTVLHIGRNGHCSIAVLIRENRT